jgi:hypothetical protein
MEEEEEEEAEGTLQHSALEFPPGESYQRFKNRSFTASGLVNFCVRL